MRTVGISHVVVICHMAGWRSLEYYGSNVLIMIIIIIIIVIIISGDAFNTSNKFSIRRQENSCFLPQKRPKTPCFPAGGQLTNKRCTVAYK
jgi:hypothetical protein